MALVEQRVGTGARAQRIARARELRGEGLLLREIAVALGVAVATVSAWLDDPDGSKLAERKRRYRGSCVDCGAATSGSNGRAGAPQRCRACMVRRRSDGARWTRVSVIEAVCEFERRYGRPPAAADWDSAQARRLGHTRRAERFHADGCWPWQAQVLRLFGRWNNAIAAAGFAPTPTGRYDRGLAAELRAAEQRAEDGLADRSSPGGLMSKRGRTQPARRAA